MIDGKNHMAVIQLKLLGFPLANIRKSLHKLTGITQPKMAVLVETSRQNITHHIDGKRSHFDIQEKIAATWKIPVDDLFDIQKKNPVIEEAAKLADDIKTVLSKEKVA